jgi:hypothetical protein
MQPLKKQKLTADRMPSRHFLNLNSSPGRGWWWRGVKGVKKAPTPPGICKNSSKKGRFPTLIDLKITKNAVFYSKLIRFISKMFSEKYMNKKKFVT